MDKSNFDQHIAGPWCAGVYNPHIVFDRKGEEVVTVHNHHEQAVPRAFLIAAAPNLFEALAQIASYKTSDEIEAEGEDFFELGGEMAYDDMINMARTAVLLATSFHVRRPEMVSL